jgi:hypothetical protein
MHLTRKSWASRRFELWLATALAINTVAWVVSLRLHRPAALYGAAFDVAVTVPALYFWMVVRSGLRSAATLIPLCALAVWRATYVAHGAAPLRPFLGAAAEAAILGFLLVQLRRQWRRADRDEDFLECLQTAARGILPIPLAAEIAATELAVFGYAFTSRTSPHVPAGMRAFPATERSGAALLFTSLAVLVGLEMPVLHLVLARWSVMAAWIATALDLYGMVWLIAIARSFGRRPVLLGDGVLDIRCGILWTLRVPLDQVAAVRPGVANECPHAPPASDPNVTVEFRKPVEVRAMYGRRKRIERVSLALDDATAFIAACSGPRRLPEAPELR